MGHDSGKKIARFRDPVAAGLLLCAAVALGGLYFWLAPAPVIEMSDAALAQVRAREKAKAVQPAAAKPAEKPAPKPAPAFKVAHKDDALNFSSRPADFTLTSDKFVSSASAKGKEVKDWTGPGDLSLLVWVGHDKDNLVIQADVKDDKHVQKAGIRAPGDMFNEDSLQVALIVPGVGPQWEFGFALGDNGRLLRHCWMSPTFKTPLKPAELSSALESIDLNVLRIEGGLRYVMKFPLKSLRLSMDHLKQGIRMNILVNDTDDPANQRKCWLELTGGIAMNKETTTFAEVKFEK